jgi:hypothetical protein
LSLSPLTLPSPLISFTLFFACQSSPPLTTLWEPSALNVELRRAACTYLLTHARVDRCLSPLLSLLTAGSASRTLILPEIFKWYWRDFGENKQAVLATVLRLAGKESWLHHDIVKYVDQHKPKIAHSPFDWRFVLVI